MILLGEKLEKSYPAPTALRLRDLGREHCTEGGVREVLLDRNHEVRKLAVKETLGRRKSKYDRCQE